MFDQRRSQSGTTRSGACAPATSCICALTLELAPRRIRVNVIAPGLTDTPMVHAIPGHIEPGLPSVPLGELVRAEEVAALAVHLRSDDASHLTGAGLSIDEGRTDG
jgi:NAD(P)-dependent dehydrogenase (short-subunit alcohol dehydrogenase family)